MAVNINADGGTAPAASLFPFYEKKQEIKTFIIVTDEEENTAFNGFRWVIQVSRSRTEVHSLLSLTGYGTNAILIFLDERKDAC